MDSRCRRTSSAKQGQGQFEEGEEGSSCLSRHPGCCPIPAEFAPAVKPGLWQIICLWGLVKPGPPLTLSEALCAPRVRRHPLQSLKTNSLGIVPNKISLQVSLGKGKLKPQEQQQDGQTDPTEHCQAYHFPWCRRAARRATASSPKNNPSAARTMGGPACSCQGVKGQ